MVDLNAVISWAGTIFTAILAYTAWKTLRKQFPSELEKRLKKDEAEITRLNIEANEQRQAIELIRNDIEWLKENRKEEYDRLQVIESRIDSFLRRGR